MSPKIFIIPIFIIPPVYTCTALLIPAIRFLCGVTRDLTRTIPAIELIRRDLFLCIFQENYCCRGEGFHRVFLTLFSQLPISIVLY